MRSTDDLCSVTAIQIKCAPYAQAVCFVCSACKWLHSVWQLPPRATCAAAEVPRLQGGKGKRKPKIKTLTPATFVKAPDASEPGSAGAKQRTPKLSVQQKQLAAAAQQLQEASSSDIDEGAHPDQLATGGSGDESSDGAMPDDLAAGAAQVDADSASDSEMEGASSGSSDGAAKQQDAPANGTVQLDPLIDEDDTSEEGDLDGASAEDASEDSLGGLCGEISGGTNSEEGSSDAEEAPELDQAKQAGLTAFEKKAQKHAKAAARERALADEEAAAMLETNVEEVWHNVMCCIFAQQCLQATCFLV